MHSSSLVTVAFFSQYKQLQMVGVIPSDVDRALGSSGVCCSPESVGTRGTSEGGIDPVRRIGARCAWTSALSKAEEMCHQLLYNMIACEQPSFIICNTPRADLRQSSVEIG